MPTNPKRATEGEDWWQCLQRVRKKLEASGHQFRTTEDIDAEIEDTRSGDERLEEVYRNRDGERRRQ